MGGCPPLDTVSKRVSPKADDGCSRDVPMGKPRSAHTPNWKGLIPPKETEVCLPQSQDQSVDFIRENPDSGQAFKAMDGGCQIEVWGRNQSID